MARVGDRRGAKRSKFFYRKHNHSHPVPSLRPLAVSCAEIFGRVVKGVYDSSWGLQRFTGYNLEHCRLVSVFDSTVVDVSTINGGYAPGFYNSF